MRAKFDYKNHSIVIERGFTGAKMMIDNKKCDEKVGAFSAQFRSFDLCGEFQNPDGTTEHVKVSVRIGFVHDDVVLFCDGKEIETQKVRA